MSIMLPGFLIPPLSWIGLYWPDIDEDKLFEVANNWGSTKDLNFEVLQKACHAADMVCNQESIQGVDDQTVDAFRTWFYSPDGPAEVLKNNGVGSDLIRLSCYVMAVVVIVLKIAFVIRLIILLVENAAAIAAAVETFGASLSSIPAFIALCQALVKAAIELAVQEIKNVVQSLLDNMLQIVIRVAVRQGSAALGAIVAGENVGDAFTGIGTGAFGQIKHDVTHGIDPAKGAKSPFSTD